MKVHWTEAVEAQLDAIYTYIAQSSPTYALRTIDRVTSKSKQIATFPLSGRKVPEYELDQIREVFSDPYRIIYYIKPDQIDVIAGKKKKKKGTLPNTTIISFFFIG